MSAWVDRHGKRSGKRSASRKKGQGWTNDAQMKTPDVTTRAFFPTHRQTGSYHRTRTRSSLRSLTLKGAGPLGAARWSQATGPRFLVLCPWHSERTPSCSVKLASDGTIAAHCFGCGAGGDVLSLVAAARGLDARRDFGESSSLPPIWPVVPWMATARPCVEPCQRRDCRPGRKRRRIVGSVKACHR